MENDIKEEAPIMSPLPHFKPAPAPVTISILKITNFE